MRGAEAFELTRAVNAGCGFACTIHANSAADALEALVNAALMAGENIPERVVRKVFSSSVDLVVHLERGVEANGSGVQRQTMEIRAMVPSLHEDFSTELLFSRDRIGGALKWTGALPPDSLVKRLEESPGARSPVSRLMEQGAGSW